MGGGWVLAFGPSSAEAACARPAATWAACDDFPLRAESLCFLFGFSDVMRLPESSWTVSYRGTILLELGS